MGMIVSSVVFGSFATFNHLSGELLEKATRVLTAEEQAVLDQEWVGKDGSKRRLEVYTLVDFYLSRKLIGYLLLDDHGSPEIKKILPIWN